MEPPSTGNERLRELLAECLARLERDGSAAMETFLAGHPEHSDVLRRRLQLLRGAGVVEPASHAPPDPVPERLGPFRLRERLGSGGMGVVYRAEQEPLGRSVALKLIRPEHLYFEGSRRRFQREVEACARLTNQSIVPVYVVGEAQGIPYFAMERIEGASLAEVLAQLNGREPAALAGIVISARGLTAQSGMGVMYELDAIAMAVIGGISLSGGRGSILGTVFGALIFGVIISGFTFLKLDAYYQEMVKGAIIVGAVVLDQWRQRRAAARA
jgi:hypothetical protein